MSHSAAHTHGHGHSHSHGEGASHAPGGTWTHENVHLYEQQPTAAEMGDRVPKAMREVYPFDEDTTTVMDFACGTGLISRGLAPYCKSIVGVDISQAMVDFYNEKVHNQGIPPEEMRAVCADLKGEISELDGQKFDVIVCSAAYHHLESIDDTTRVLSFFLKPGGCLLVVDFMKSDQPVPEDVPNSGGFTEADIRKAFVGARLDGFEFDPFTKAMFHGQRVTVFLAKGSKPASV
ncbi:S-adenosyl-L-methionine-dependent methyltransferase [Roridomyces roridus]|uniref:S-adenosyl-L-methionine-dependent methyltransferase n=1 Tax=Roridomyces roridus TaxID=1738132 RepID=A0AAD7B6R9_9AGAR|nr:S-adenosyl-L-methionine-dependent methyltransferase [Roridomyces roridus]